MISLEPSISPGRKARARVFSLVWLREKWGSAGLWWITSPIVELELQSFWSEAILPSSSFFSSFCLCDVPAVGHTLSRHQGFSRPSLALCTWSTFPDLEGPIVKYKGTNIKSFIGTKVLERLWCKYAQSCRRRWGTLVNWMWGCGKGVVMP